VAIAGSMLGQAEFEPMFLRKRLEYTQADLAEHLRLDRATANRWEQEGGRLTGANSYALRSHVFMQLRDRAGKHFAEAEKALKEHSAPRLGVPGYRTLDVERLRAAQRGSGSQPRQPPAKRSVESKGLTVIAGSSKRPPGPVASNRT